MPTWLVLGENNEVETVQNISGTPAITAEEAGFIEVPEGIEVPQDPHAYLYVDGVFSLNPVVVEQRMREEQDRLCRRYDYIVLRYAEKTPSEFDAWKQSAEGQMVLEYRQAVRDVDKQTSWPFDLVWPSRDALKSHFGR